MGRSVRGSTGVYGQAVDLSETRYWLGWQPTTIQDQLGEIAEDGVFAINLFRDLLPHQAYFVPYGRLHSLMF